MPEIVDTFCSSQIIESSNVSSKVQIQKFKCKTNLFSFLLRYGRKFSSALLFIDMQLFPCQNHCVYGSKNLVKINVTFISLSVLTHYQISGIWSSYVVCLRNTMWSSYLIKTLPTGKLFLVVLSKKFIVPFTRKLA